MRSPRSLLLLGLSALALAAPLFTASGCKPKVKSTPAPFTAQLTELEGVQAVYTLRHPKLIIADLDKLMAEVPEAALLRMGLGQLTPFGYPEFSELTAGANIGVALLQSPMADWQAGKFTLIGFAQLKEGGKIWTALTKQGLTLQQHGAWTWIAKDPASFAQIKAPDALTAFIARPQTEELRTWGRLTPSLLASLHEQLWPKLQAKLKERPADEQKALLAYAEIAWSYLGQLHSGTSGLGLTDHGITLSGSAQFLPDSALGTLLRYPAAAAPVAAAQSLPDDALISLVARGNTTGQLAFIDGLLDALIAVDYPAMAEPLKRSKASYHTLHENSTAGMIASIDVPSLGGKEKPSTPVKMLGLVTGEFTEAQVAAYYRDSVEVSNKLTNAALSALSTLNPTAPLPETHQQLTDNALTIDGIRFGTLVTTSKIKVAGSDQTTTVTVFYGVVDGNLVYATDEATLRAKLPGLHAGKPVPDGVKLAPQGDEVALVAVHGGKIVQMVADSAQLDQKDADIAAQIKTLKDGYAAAGPVLMSASASQAQATMSLTIPYKFIAQSVKLGQFASANRAKTASR